MFFRKSIALLLVIYISNSAIGQSISGKIVDTKSAAIPGASIHLLNTNIFTFADAQGNFEIKYLLSGPYELTVSAEGYATINLKIAVGNHDRNLSIQLTRNIIQMDEVVVTAQKKKHPCKIHRWVLRL